MTRRVPQASLAARAAVLVMAALLLVACTSGGISPPTRGPDTGSSSSPRAEASARPTATAGLPSSGGPGTSPAAALDAWRTARLTDVRSGETFRITDLAGSLVVIEPMAIWCVNCARQQQQVARALAALDRADVVYVSLDVDPQEAETDLAAYADERGFGWRFVVAPRAVARSLAQALGDQVLSPPSTPRIVVTPSGEVLGPHFGIVDAARLEAELRALLS